MLAKRNFDATLLVPICLRPCLNIPYPRVRHGGPEEYDLNNYKHFESSERREARVRHNRNMFLQSLAKLTSVDSVLSVRGENLLLGLTDGTDHTDYFVADCNLLLHQSLARLHIREICDICERRKLLKIYL